MARRIAIFIGFILLSQSTGYGQVDPAISRYYWNLVQTHGSIADPNSLVRGLRQKQMNPPYQPPLEFHPEWVGPLQPVIAPFGYQKGSAKKSSRKKKPASSKGTPKRKSETASPKQSGGGEVKEASSKKTETGSSGKEN